MNVQKNIPQTLSQSQTQPKNLIPNQPKIITIPQPEYAKLLKYHGDTIPMMVFNPNNKQLISCSFDKNVLVWDLTNLKKLPKIGMGHTSLINDIAMAPNGNFYATASSDHTIRIWSATDDYTTAGKNISSQVIRMNETPVKSIDISCDSRLIATGADDKTVKLISINDKKLQANLLAHTNWVKTVRFSRDSLLVASGSDDSTLKLWDTYKKKLVYDFKNGVHKGAVNCVRFHPDNSCLATACFDGKIRIFDVRSKQLVQNYKEHDRPATCVSFHPSGNFLASTAYDNTIKIYDLRIGETLFTLKAHESAVMSCCFSTFGDYLATGGFDSTIVLWKTNLESYINIDVSDILERKSKSLMIGSESYDNFGTKNLNMNMMSNNNVKMSGSNNLNLNTNQNLEDNIGENLSNFFERMVSQMDFITNSFANFDQRLERMEKLVDEMNEEDLKNNNIQ
jgi:centriolar protein POC1